MSRSRPVAVSIVGSTGSIGTQAIDVVRSAPGDYEVVALAANRSIESLVAQAALLRPGLVAVVDEDAAAALDGRLPEGTELVAGEGALVEAARRGDIVVNGVVGFAGLPVTVEALQRGARLALANKESLIAGAPVVQAARATPGAEIVPVDSEHCAVHQCLGSHVGGSDEVRRIVLTASGGPFRGRSAASLQGVTVEQALAHPTWKMGPKITVDSSTLMNKGLEVIEAHELFGVDYDRIEVVVHPQSIVHSMVEFCDGATIAQLSNPDMRLPIGYALAWPARLRTAFGVLDWSTVEKLEFEPPDTGTFACLGLAYAAGRAGNSAPAWLNAANEVAVDAFLAGRLTWPSIASLVASTLDEHEETKLVEVGDVLDADAAARRVATRVLETMGSAS